MRSKNRPASITQADVARHAGVSQALVSIVFRNTNGASPQTRERVFRAADELGYRLDRRARLLAGNHSGTLGITFMLGHEFHADLVRYLYEETAAHGFELLLSGVTPGHPEEVAVQFLMGYRCEALILLAPQFRVSELETIAAEQPVVVVSRTVRSAHMDVVRIDERAGAREGTQHLIDLGHRDITHVHGGGNIGGAERRAGYKDAMRAAGLEEHIDLVSGGPQDDDGERAAAEILSRPSHPTAILAFNDHCATGVIAAMRTAGLSVPGQVSVTGFDNAGVADLATVRLTTVSQNPRELARVAMQRVLARLEGGPAVETTIAFDLVERATTAPARAYAFDSRSSGTPATA